MKITAVIVLSGLLLSILCLIPSVSAQPAQPAQPAQSSPALLVSYSVKLDDHYSLYGDVLQQYNIQIQGSNFASTRPLILQVIFYFDYEGVSIQGAGANYTLTQDGFGTNYLTVTLPPSTSSFNVTVSGSHSDYSVLYRSVATVPPINVSMSAAPFVPTASSFTAEDPPGMDIFSVSGGDPGATIHTTAVGSSDYVTSTLPTTNNLVILYQISDGDLLTFLYLAIIVMVVLWSPPLYRRLRGRTTNVLPKFASATRRVLGWFTSRRLLEVFVGVSLAMLGIALIFGPSPVPRVYLAATPATSQVLGPIISDAGFAYLTPINAGDQFDTMSTLGNYNLIILADYPPTIADPGIVADYYRVFVMTDYAPPQYGTTLREVYGSPVTLLNNTQQLSSVLNNARFYVPASNLGLPVTEGQYKVALVAEAIFTFLVVFVAMAYLARVLVERGERGISGVAEGAFYCIAVFMATTIVFIQTSELLGLPVALHAGFSAESAVGALGFGGGSRPRQLLGTLGFFFGAVAGTKGRMKVDRVGLLAFIGVITFIAIDPLSLGQSFYQLLITFSTNEQPPTGVLADSNTRGLLSSVMNLFGHNISEYFYSSHGSVLFFLAGLPFALFSKVRKSAATFLLLFSALAAPLGFIRVADLNPTESMASAIPGIVLGLGVVILFLVASFLESRIRKNLPTI